MQFAWRVPWPELAHERDISVPQLLRGAWEGGEETWGKPSQLLLVTPDPYICV